MEGFLMEDDVVRLERFERPEDMDYLLDLAMKCKYTHITRDEAKRVMNQYPIEAWNCFDKKTGVKGGVAYLTKMPQFWTLDAYKDDELMKSIDNAMDYSYRVGKLVCDYAFQFVDTLMTCHRAENRGATIVCKKLGFKEDFIMLKKEKN
jgi:RimJ/RimL family protein N-acetyltransferase